MLAKAAGVVKRASTLSWSELAPLAASYTPPEPATGPAHSQSLLRTFGYAEEAVRVTLYRDYHAWCPYCQKVWLWLEEKRVPYKVQKVTMFCYGTKEQWYKRIVPSGMLPAAEIDGRVVTESDVILQQLEAAFGALGEPMSAITAQRRLERQLFSAWCDWLCRPSSSDADDAAKQTAFENVLQRLESEMGATAGPWLRGGAQPSTADVIFVPYVERMSASLYYYKGFTMRDASQRPALCRWFDALEARESYRGTQSDYHTHVHDLPPQMGGCFANNTSMQRINAARVDNGPWAGLPDTSSDEPPTSCAEAAFRVLRHKDSIIACNPCAAPDVVDEALRCALTLLLTGEQCAPPADCHADAALRYVRDRVNVPRDMSLWAARRLRQALETTASIAGPKQAPAIPTDHRRDQNPAPFLRPPLAARQ